MFKKILLCLLALVLLFSLPLFLAAEESVGHKIGQFGRDVSDTVRESYQETKKASHDAYQGSKKAGKEAGAGMKKESKSAWSKSKQWGKDFWQDVKNGFGGKEKK